MPTSVPGSSARSASNLRARSHPSDSGARRRSAGFTLIELMVVVAIVAIATGLVSIALRDGAQNQLDQEAARLAALLEGARAEARATGIPVRWTPIIDDDARPGGAHFRFVGLPAASGLPDRWLQEGVTAEVIGAKSLVLGPEPVIGAQRVVLQFEDRRAVIATDGLGPFALDPDEKP